MPHQHSNRVVTKLERKFHKRGCANLVKRVYAVNHLQLTPTTSGALHQPSTSTTYCASQMGKMDILLFVRTYNSCPVPKGKTDVTSAQEELGSSSLAAGLNRRDSLLSQEAWLRGERAPFSISASQNAVPGRDGVNHAALRDGMVGRTARLVRPFAFIANHFDASTGAICSPQIAPVLLSNGWEGRSKEMLYIPLDIESLKRGSRRSQIRAKARG